MSESPWEQEYETVGDALREHLDEEPVESEDWREVPPSTIL